MFRDMLKVFAETSKTIYSPLCRVSCARQLAPASAPGSGGGRSASDPAEASRCGVDALPQQEMMTRREVVTCAAGAGDSRSRGGSAGMELKFINWNSLFVCCRIDVE